jgi:addiction module HigA family antidote
MKSHLSRNYWDEKLGHVKPMGVSVRAVAMALHVPYSRLSEITKGERGVSADTALRLERYFGSEARAG